MGEVVDVYVGSYTAAAGALPWVGSHGGAGITRLTLNPATGKLSATGEVVAQQSPTWLEVDPSGTFLVATTELSHHTGAAKGTGFVTSYRIRDDGSLAAVRARSTGGLGNTCCSFDRTGRFLLVTRYWEGGVSALPWDAATGEIGPVCAAPDHEGPCGPHPLRQAVPHPHGVHGDRETDAVYAADLGTDAIHRYRLTAAGGLDPVARVPIGVQRHGSMRDENS